MIQQETNLLSGLTAIVTGAAQGIGLAIAKRMLENGASVMIADINAAKVDDALAELDAGDKAAGTRCDVTVASDVEALVAHSITTFGRLDILVNNAGVTRDAYIAKMSEADFDAVLAVSLKGAWLGTRAVAPVFRGQGHGSVINISSMSGKIGNPGQTNYSAAKAGLVGMTKASAKEFGSAGVRVNAVMPGLIRTAMTEAMKPEVFQAREQEIPLRRAGEPPEVAGAVVFLASPLASYITGVVVEVAGGRGM